MGNRQNQSCKLCLLDSWSQACRRAGWSWRGTHRAHAPTPLQHVPNAEVSANAEAKSDATVATTDAHSSERRCHRRWLLLLGLLAIGSSHEAESVHSVRQQRCELRMHMGKNSLLLCLGRGFHCRRAAAAA